MTLQQLPILGVGLSLSLATKPDPVALVKHPQGASFIEYAGLVDVQSVLPEVERIHAAGVPVLYHPSYINFVVRLPIIARGYKRQHIISARCNPLGLLKIAPIAFGKQGKVIPRNWAILFRLF